MIIHILKPYILKTTDVTTDVEQNWNYKSASEVLERVFSIDELIAVQPDWSGQFSCNLQSPLIETHSVSEIGPSNASITSAIKIYQYVMQNLYTLSKEN